MKKKVSPIKLHNLSEAEMESRELNLLRGGSGDGKTCGCISICLYEDCLCTMDIESVLVFTRDHLTDRAENKISKQVANSTHRGENEGSI